MACRTWTWATPSIRHDWANAVNAYWSPLYPWTVGLVLGAAQPSPKWEFPLVHLVNFGVFVVALFAFRFLLHALLAFASEPMPDKPTADASPNDSEALPEWALVILAYAIFLWTALEVERMFEVTPDLAVLACVCLTAGMLLRLRPVRHALEVRVVWPHPRLWLLDESNIVPASACDSRRRLFMETFAPRLGTRNGCSRSGLSMRLGSVDLLAVSPEGPLHVWRFGEAELCVVCVSPNVLEKLAGRRTSPGQWNAGSSYSPTAAASSAL